MLAGLKYRVRNGNCHLHVKHGITIV
jgi:hypothetical protein